MKPFVLATAVLLWIASQEVRAEPPSPPTAMLVGEVVDARTRAPIGDVVVTASSPALGGWEMDRTEADGSYRHPQLPGGVYSLEFEKHGYRSLVRSWIDVGEDRTVPIDVELEPEEVGTAGAEPQPPVLDVSYCGVGSPPPSGWSVPVRGAGGAPDPGAVSSPGSETPAGYDPDEPGPHDETMTLR